MKIFGPNRIEQLLKEQIADIRAAHQKELANLRADHSQTVSLLTKQIELLREDLNRTRLLLNPGLAVDRTDTGPPPTIPPEEQGTAWERVRKRIIDQQEEMAKAAVARQKQADAEAAAMQTGAKSGSAAVPS